MFMKAMSSALVLVCIVGEKSNLGVMDCPEAGVIIRCILPYP